MSAGIAINYLQSIHKDTSSEKKEAMSSASLREIKPRTIKVDVSGAVEKPGVYEIPDDSRVKDVLITAGGLSAKADRNYLSKNINMAQRLADGQKVYFPFQGESAPVLGTSVTATSLININTASEADLDTLPGVGPATAGKIMAGRPYQNISELLSKKTISNSIYLKIKDRVTIN